MVIYLLKSYNNITDQFLTDLGEITDETNHKYKHMSK